MKDSSAVIMVRLFGEPGLYTTNGPARLARRRSLALIAYLALAPSPIARERLAHFLWPNSMVSVGLSNLRNSLSDLNTTPIRPYLIIERDRIGLADDLWIDARRFSSLCDRVRRTPCGEPVLSAECADWMEAAVSLARGPFLAGFRVDGSPEFDDWQVLRASTFQRQLEGILVQLIEHYHALCANSRVTELAARLLVIDPLNEEALQRYMEACARQGMADTALRAYRDHERFIMRDLQRPLHPATHALAERIRAGDITPTENSSF